MVRPCGARGFRRPGCCGLALLYPASDWSVCSRPSWISARIRPDSRKSLRLSKFLQRRARWREERCAGVRGREIEQPVVNAGRIAYIHSLQHLLDHPKISRIAYKIRAKLPLARTTEWHVIAQYIIFVAVCIYN